MSKLEDLAAERAALKAEVIELDALTEPTAEQAERAEKAAEEFDEKDKAYRAEAERAEKVERIRSAADHEGSTERAYGNVNVQISKDPFEDLDQLRYADRDDENVRDRALSAFESKSVRGISDDERENLLTRIDTVPGVAAHALAHGSKAYRSAYMKFMKSGGNPHYTPEEEDAVRTALNITTGASGQFSLPTIFDPTLIHTGTAAINPVRSLARVETISQNVWNGVSVGNVTTYWHAEAAALTDGSPTLAHPIVTAGHLTAWVPASWEFFDDSAMVAQLPGLIGEAFDYAESTAFVSGSGTSSPKGIVTAISTTIASTVTATTRGAFTSASSADLFALVNSVTPRYELSSTFLANKATYNVIRQMSPNGAGSYFWGQLSQNVAPNPGQELLGYPTRNSSDVLSTTTTGTCLIVLGDMSLYLIVDVVGTTVEFVQNVVNSSGIPTGQRGVVARKRVGGNVLDLNAFRFLLV